MSMAVAAHEGQQETLDELPRVEYALLKAHGYAAVITLFISAIFGSLVALKFTYPDLLSQDAWLTWGRLRYDHTQGILFGWLGNAFLASLYHMIPRLANRPVTSRRLGWLLFVTWNFFMLVPGWVLISVGAPHWLFAVQPLEWAEFPVISDVFVVLGLLLMAVQFVWPLLRKRESGGLYVSAWYIIGGTVFTLLAYPVGNFVPALVPGAQGAAFSGLWIHDAIGLYVTPFVLAISYYVIPAATRRPIYSHFLSMIGFWVLFFMYPLNGTHHYVFSAIPMDVQKAAIIASAYLGMDVILVVFNQLMSMRGESATVARNIPLRFVWTGTIFYLIVSIQGSLQALMPVNQLVHFSDWVIGHSHLAMLGFASFIAIGGIAHAWQRIPNARYNEAAMGWVFWLLLSGLLLMVIDLTAAGLVQGELWQSEVPWIDSVRAVRGYWMVRAASGVPILLAFISFFIGITSGPRNAQAARARPLRAPQPSPQLASVTAGAH